VYALPKGGVVIGYELAKNLKLPLELIITKKIGAPKYPQYIIGVVSENGHYLIDDVEIFSDRQWLENEIKKEKENIIKIKEKYYLQLNHNRLKGKNKVAIIVDDGAATGLSLCSAIDEVLNEEPSEIVIAVPVMSPDTAYMISQISDKLIVLDRTSDNIFGAISNHYKNFKELLDKDVVRLLSKVWGSDKRKKKEV
jgi:predicted phosphoribosyltransferase